MTDEAARLSKLRDKLETTLLQLEEAHVNGDKQHRLPQITNISFKYVEGEGLMMAFNKDIAVFFRKCLYVSFIGTLLRAESTRFRGMTWHILRYVFPSDDLQRKNKWIIRFNALPMR
jgi:hypothetical protein